MVKNPFTLVLFAGEASGDLHGSHLMLALKKLDPTLQFLGVGGPKMRAAGLKPIFNMEDFEVMGFVQVFLHLPSLLKKFHVLKNKILSLQPAALISIDYPDFSLKLAKALRKKKFKGKIIHYISPSVWAWRKKRIGFIAKHFDSLLSILPFEKELFSQTDLDVTYVGHPLVQTLKDHPFKKILLKTPYLALFPGSRLSIIKKNLPALLALAKTFSKDYHIYISCADARFHSLLEHHAKEIKAEIISSEFRYELMKGASLAIATCGTVNLELALHETPTLVLYKLSFFDYLIARYLFRIKLRFFTLPNLLLNQTVFPEFIHYKIPFDSALKKAQFLLSSQGQIDCKTACKNLRAYLGKEDASHNAALKILDVLRKK